MGVHLMTFKDFGADLRVAGRFDAAPLGIERWGEPRDSAPPTWPCFAADAAAMRKLIGFVGAPLPDCWADAIASGDRDGARGIIDPPMLCWPFGLRLGIERR